jgi:hypothetical protein
MNDYRSKVALSIIAEYFGDVVHEVCLVMLLNDNKCSLAQIIRDLNDPVVMMRDQTFSGGGGGGARTSFSSKVGGTGVMVRQALSILNHHNCLSIVATDAPINDRDDKPNDKLPIQGSSSSYLYSLDIGGILQRLRFPKLLLHVHKRFGSLASCLVEEVMLLMMMMMIMMLMMVCRCC